MKPSLFIALEMTSSAAEEQQCSALIASSAQRAAQICGGSWNVLQEHATRVQPFVTSEIVLQVASPASSGISDFVAGLISAYALAVATARKFRVDWPALDRAFQAPASSFFLQDDERAALSSALLSSVLSSSSARAPATRVELYDWLSREAPNEEEWRVLTSGSLNASFSAKTSVVRWRRGVLSRAFEAQSSLGRWLQDHGFTRESAFSCLYHHLLTPRPEALSPHEANLARLRKWPRRVLGLHIRTGDAPISGLASDGSLIATGSTARTFSPLEQPLYGFRGWPQRTSRVEELLSQRGQVPNNTWIVLCAEAIEAEMARSAQPRHRRKGKGSKSRRKARVAWYVASDSAAVVRQIAEEYNTATRTVVASAVEEPMHSAAWPHWKALAGVGLYENEDPARADEVLAYESQPAVHSRLEMAAVDALIEQWVLGQADAHVLGVHSGFGRIAHAISLAALERGAGDAAAVDDGGSVIGHAMLVGAPMGQSREPGECNMYPYQVIDQMGAML